MGKNKKDVMDMRFIRLCERVECMENPTKPNAQRPNNKQTVRFRSGLAALLL